jgi:hypothetical protein
MYRFKCLDFEVLRNLTPAQIGFLQEGLRVYDRKKARAQRRGKRR